jgi:hypothetical protein
MTTHAFQFVELTSQERKKADSFPKLAKRDRVEVRIRHGAGGDKTVLLSPAAASLVETLLRHLLNGERVAVLTEDQEVSPNDAATILGISRPLVVHRMEVGDLPFRYVGKHRRAKLKDVFALKARIDQQQSALDELAEDTEKLIRGHAL